MEHGEVIAYFSIEVAPRPESPTNSGGLAS